MKPPTLTSFRLKNFKAVKDSGQIKLTPLTVFIGNNGSGKSSVIEGLETYQSIVTDGLDKAMQQWHGFEHVWNKAARHDRRDRQTPSSQRRDEGRPSHTNPMSFYLAGHTGREAFRSTLEINLGPGGNDLFIQSEELVEGKKFTIIRDSTGKATLHSPASPLRHGPFDDGQSAIGGNTKVFVAGWQFLSLIPQSMGAPLPQNRSGGQIRLAKDGSNIAEYLLGIYNLDAPTFNGIIESVQYVLPYARDFQAAITSELERTVYLQMTEREFKVPGWLLSTGTLRLLSLLALLRHPTPPPLIIIEELENGLDPRTLQLLIEEFQTVVKSQRTQLIITTHSPYLLDLLSLEHIILVERIDGTPTFTRPGDNKALEAWSKKFSPGSLYTMGRLSGEALNAKG